MSHPADTTARKSETPERIPVGVSSCLLGEAVRYDGGHKHDHYVTGVLGWYFEYVAWCPEALAGLGVPRPPIRLAADPGACSTGGGTTLGAMASIAGGEPTARKSSTRTVQDDGTGLPSVPSHATPR